MPPNGRKGGGKNKNAADKALVESVSMTKYLVAFARAAFILLWRCPCLRRRLVSEGNCHGRWVH